MKKIVVIDNYDSFTFNLVHYLEDLDCEVTVLRNDKFELDDVEYFDKILLSPGPGIPEEAGLLNAVIRRYASTKSILGVCLGQQAIGDVFGQVMSLRHKIFDVKGVQFHPESVLTPNGKQLLKNWINS